MDAVQGAQLIDGAAVAKRVRAEVARDVAALRERGIQPGLAVVIVGEDPASQIYVRNKERQAQEVGMHSEVVRLPATTTQEELLTVVDRLNRDPRIHGFLVQTPLPRQIDPDAVIRAIVPEKDVDGFHPVNVGKVLLGERDGFAPCTPTGVQELLRTSGIETLGKDLVLVGRSNIVGKPMAALMLQDELGANATVTICHRFTKDLGSHTRRADILIVAVGKPGLITADMVKPGAVVIDVGTTRVDDPSLPRGYRLTGDVDFDAVREVASYITPVPGGVGPMTIAVLLKNTVRAARLQGGLA